MPAAFCRAEILISVLKKKNNNNKLHVFFIRDYFFHRLFFYVKVSVAFLFSTMVLGKVKSFTVSYDCLNDSNVPVFSSGDCVSGRVVVEVTGEIRVKALKIHAKGFAKVRWTESRNAGSNTAYTQNYTEEVEYLNHKDILIGHERGKRVWFSFLRRSFEMLCADRGSASLKDAALFNVSENRKGGKKHYTLIENFPIVAGFYVVGVNMVHDFGWIELHR